MSGVDEKNCWTGLKQGKMDSLGGLYDLYVDELFAYGMGITSDKSSVMDGIHDLFLNLYKYHSKLGDAVSIKAYLFQSLNRILHRNGRNKLIPLEDAEKVISLAKSDTNTPSHEAQIITLEESCAIKSKVDQARKLLTQNQQKVLHMRFEEDKSYEEIAERMRISVASARTIVYRTLKILRGGILILLIAFS